MSAIASSAMTMKLCYWIIATQNNGIIANVLYGQYYSISETGLWYAHIYLRQQLGQETSALHVPRHAIYATTQQSLAA